MEPLSLVVHLHLRKNIYYNSGNVGIGTSSPGSSYKLDVRGNLRVGDGSTGEQDIQFFCGSGDWQVGTNNGGNGTNSNHFFIYDTSYRFTDQKGTGNVVIGTTTPGEKLTVNGSIMLNGSSNATVTNESKIIFTRNHS